jgi:hypothetical protein
VIYPLNKLLPILNTNRPFAIWFAKECLLEDPKDPQGFACGCMSNSHIHIVMIKDEEAEAFLDFQRISEIASTIQNIFFYKPFGNLDLRRIRNSSSGFQ